MNEIYRGRQSSLFFQRWQSDALQKVGEARLTPQWLHGFIIQEQGHPVLVFLKGQFERGKSVVLLAESSIDSANPVPRSAVKLYAINQLCQYLACLPCFPVSCKSITEKTARKWRFREKGSGLLKLYRGCIKLTLSQQRQSIEQVSQGKVWLQIQSFLKLIRGIFRASTPGKDLTVHRVNNQGKWVGVLRALDDRQGFVRTSSIL